MDQLTCLNCGESIPYEHSEYHPDGIGYSRQTTHFPYCDKRECYQARRDAINAHVKAIHDKEHQKREDREREHQTWLATLSPKELSDYLLWESQQSRIQSLEDQVRELRLRASYDGRPIRSREGSYRN